MTPPLTILQFITQQEGAGAQSRAVKMMVALQQRGHTVTTVFGFLKRPAFAPSPHIINVWPCKPKIWEIPFWLFAIWRLIRQMQPDVVMPYTHWGNVVMGPLARLAGCRCVVANQTQVPSREPRLARLIDTLWGTLGVYRLNLCNSHSTLAGMQASVPATYARRLRLVTLGVDVPKTNLSKTKLRQKYGLPSGFLWLHVGRLSTQKNHALLLQALALVPTAQAVLVGDGELREALHQQAAALGLTGRVHWLGERQAAEVAELLQAADAFVFPSQWEGFGLAPIEASAAGLPLVVSDIDTFRDVMRITHGARAGQMGALLVDIQTPQPLAEAMRAIQQNPPQLAALQAQSAALAAQYSLARMTDDYETALHEALSSPTQSH